MNPFWKFIVFLLVVAGVFALGQRAHNKGEEVGRQLLASRDVEKTASILEKIDKASGTRIPTKDARAYYFIRAAEFIDSLQKTEGLPLPAGLSIMETARHLEAFDKANGRHISEAKSLNLSEADVKVFYIFQALRMLKDIKEVEKRIAEREASENPKGAGPER